MESCLRGGEHAAPLYLPVKMALLLNAYFREIER